VTNTLHLITDTPPDGTEEQATDPLTLLQQIRSRRWAYLQTALSAFVRKTKRPRLSNAEYRLLVQLVICASADLRDSYPSYTWLSERMHTDERQVRRLMGALVKKGWICRDSRSAYAGGSRSTVNQFCVPAGVLGPGAPAWTGP